LCGGRTVQELFEGEGSVHGEDYTGNASDSHLKGDCHLQYNL
jgi:hypothetical protein